MHLREAYHGDTLGAVSVGGIELFHATYRPLLLQTAIIGSPGVRAEGQKPEERAVEVVAELEAVLRERGDEVCAIVVEPMVQAAAGMLTYDAHFLREARRLATRARRAAHLRRGRHRDRPHRHDVGRASTPASCPTCSPRPRA